MERVGAWSSLVTNAKPRKRLSLLELVSPMVRLLLVMMVDSVSIHWRHVAFLGGLTCHPLLKRGSRWDAGTTPRHTARSVLPDGRARTAPTSSVPRSGLAFPPRVTHHRAYSTPTLASGGSDFHSTTVSPTVLYRIATRPSTSEEYADLGAFCSSTREDVWMSASFG